MSFSRIALISFLVLVLLATIGVGGMLVYQRFPGYRMGKAEEAVETGDYESAAIHLRKLLHKDPKNVDALLMLVDVIRDRSEAQGGSRSYRFNPHAVEVLAKAAELRPNDKDLQRELLRAYLLIGDLGKAAIVAEEVAKDEPTNADAHFALLWKAVEQRNDDKVRELYAMFDDNKITTRRIFQTLALKVQYHWKKEDEEGVAQTLSTAAWKANDLTAEQMGILLLDDRQKMLDLLLAHQQLAEEPQEALDRAKILIDSAKKLQQEELLDSRMLANAAAQSIAMFNMKFPPIHLEPTHRVLRDQLSMDAESLGTGALEDVAEADSVAPLLVYWNTARTLMTRGKHDEALKVLNDGISAAEKLDENARSQVMDLHLLAARVLIMQRKFDKANQHLDKLIGNKRFEGWSYLLKGSVALHQGRLTQAHEHFLRAEDAMGDKILVRMSLAHTHMAREEWAEAIPLLQSLQVPVDQLTDEEKAWHQQLLGGGNRVHFDLLRARLALGQWDEAQDNIRALKETELAPNAWGVVVTYLWDDAKDKAKAKKYIKLVREKYPNSLPLALLEARMLKEDGQTVAATELMENFAAGQSDELSQLALARWQIRNRQPQKALEVLSRLQQRADLSPKAQNTVNVYRVQALIGARQFEQAKKEADKLIANEGTATAGYLMKAALAFNERDEKQGIAMLEAAQQANPDNPALNMMLQRVRKAQGDFDGVLELAAGVAGIDKYQGQVQASVGEALRKIAKTQGPEAALQKANELLAKQPDDLSLIVLKVDLQLSLGRVDEAMQLLDQAQRNAPENIDIPRLKAQAWISQGNYEQALEEVKYAMQLEEEQGVEEKSVELMLLAARAAIGAQQYREGARYGDMARRADPDSPRGYLLMAEGFRKMGQVDNAVVVLESYAKRKPNDFAIHKTLAELYRENGQPDKAIAWLNRARTAQPGDIRYTLEQLAIMLKSGRKSEAQLLARDVAGDSQDISHILAVAQVFAEHGENLDAQNWGEKALAMTTPANQAAVHSFLGRIYLRRAGQEDKAAFYEKARTHFEIVRETQPRDLIAGNNLAWLLATKFGKPAEAVRVAEETRGDAEVEQLPPAFIDTMIDAYERAGQSQKALELAKEAVGEFPREAPLLYRYGVMLTGKEPAQAKQMLERAVELGLPAADEAEAKRQLARL